MTNERKLQILDGLIERCEKTTYDSKSDMIRCIDDVRSFIRNVISIDSDWIKRIDSIVWSPGIVISGGKTHFFNLGIEAKKIFLVYCTLSNQKLSFMLAHHLIVRRE